MELIDDLEHGKNELLSDLSPFDAVDFHLEVGEGAGCPAEAIINEIFGVFNTE